MITIPEGVEFTPAKSDVPFVRKLTTFVRAAARHLANGMKQVESEEQQRRLFLCMACEHFNAEKESCRKCGCGLKAKTAWQLEHCPLTPPKW